MVAVESRDGSSSVVFSFWVVVVVVLVLVLLFDVLRFGVVCSSSMDSMDWIWLGDSF